MGENTNETKTIIPENPGTNKKSRLSLTEEVDQSEVNQSQLMSENTNTIGQHKFLADS